METNIVERINGHLRTIAPHVARRETASLLRDAVLEITALKQIATSVHDGLLHGHNDKELLELLSSSWDMDKRG